MSLPIKTMNLFNPTKETIEFKCGGITYIFKPKESKELSEYIALHALERAKVPLVEHTPMYDKEVEITDVSYYKLSWNKIRSMAAARGLYKIGQSRQEIIELMEDYDNRIRGTVQKPAD